MTFGWWILSLEVTFDNRYALLARVAGFLDATAASGGYGGATGLSLLPLLAALNALSSAFGGDLSGCGLATIGHRPYVA
jgi:hypothetical protein